MRFLLLILTIVAIQPASADTILSNTADTEGKNVIGCYFALNTAGSLKPPCFNGNEVANNKSVWIGVGFAMGTTGYPLLEIDVDLIITGLSKCTGCSNDFGAYLFSDNAGVPGSLLDTLTSTPGETRGTPVAYAFTPSSTVTLSANTNYWVLFQADYPTFGLLAGTNALTGSGASYIGTLQSSSTLSSNAPLGANPVAALQSNGNTNLNPYFVLQVDTSSSATPEPATFLLAGGTLAAFCLRCRARR